MLLIAVLFQRGATSDKTMRLQRGQKEACESQTTFYWIL